MWKYGRKTIKSIEDTPEGSVGFIYKITNLDNGMYYFGRKSLRSTTRKRLTKKQKTLAENKRKTFVTEVKETNWLKYTGSCKPLNEDIRNGAKIKKEIVRFCYNKKQLSYYEIQAIVCSDCLELENCYNGNLLGKFFPNDLKNEE